MIDIGKDLANAYEEGMRDARAKLDNEVFELQTEVKRLERICHSYALQYGTVTDKQKVIDKAKAEVIEEIEREIEKFERDANKCLEEYKSPAAKPFIDLCEGKLVGLNEARQAVSVLKKKYAKGERS